MWRSAIYKLCMVINVCIMFLHSLSVYSADIKSFKLTDYDGKVSVKYFADEQEYTRTSISGDNSNDIQEIEIDLQAHGYIYHPNFASVHFGGGPVLTRNALESNEHSDFTGDTQSTNEDVNDVTYNFNGKVNFLEKKPYPFSVYLERRNPLVVSGFGEHFTQQNTKYGTTAVWRDLTMPVSLNFEYQHINSEGNSKSLVVDDEFENIQISVTQNNKKTGHRQFTIQLSESLSNSGNTGPVTQPIVSSEVETTSINYDEFSVFGDNSEYTLRNIFSNITRKFIRDIAPTRVDMKQLQLTPDFRWNHASDTQSYYKFDYFDSSQNEVDTTNKNLNIGITKQHEGYGSNNANLIILNNRSTGFKLSSYGIFGSTNFLKLFGEPDYMDLTRPDPSAIGPTRQLSEEETEKLRLKRMRELSTSRAKFQIRGGYQVYDRESSNDGDSIVVQNESHNLPDSQNVKLNNELVNLNSIEVFNVNKTQLYTEGIDYAVVVIGNDTFIRRLVGGNIIDNEIVLVDYTYRLSGTFSYTSFDHQYQMSIDFHKKLNILAGLFFKEIDVTEGTPGISLSSQETRTLEFSYDTPIMNSANIGANYRIDDQVRGVSPNERQSASVYVQFGLFNTTFIRFTTQLLTVNYENELEDVDLKRYYLRMTSRPFRRSTMLLTAITEEDTGGTYPRKLTDITFKWQWSIRKIFLSFDARYNTESQTTNATDVTQDRSLIRLTVERNF